MTLWFTIVLLALLALTALHVGAHRIAVRSTATTDEAARAHREVYKAQLAEIDADLAQGVLQKGEAEGQRNEVARRLLAVAPPLIAEAGTHSRTLDRTLGLVAALLVPALALGLYSLLGTPAQEDVPQAQRLARAEQAGDLEAMVYKVEQHLKQKPDDAVGWEIVIPSYKSMGRYGAAAEAYRRLIAIRGPAAELYANLAEMLLFEGNGLLPKEAGDAARVALALEPANPQARYFDALSLAQEGGHALALARFQSLLADTPAGAAWRQAVEQQIAQLQEQAAQAPMIAAMVEGLDAKLKAEPQNLQGWLRLIRARVVLKEVETARTSLAAARKIFAADDASLHSLLVLAEELELQ